MIIIILFLFKDEDYEPTTFNTNKRPGYTAPAALLNDVAQVYFKNIILINVADDINN